MALGRQGGRAPLWRMSDEDVALPGPDPAEAQTDLERKIFGASSDDEANGEMLVNGDGEDMAHDNDEVDEEEEEAVQTTRRKRGTGRKPAVEKAPGKASAGPSDRILEARREFDEALEKIKGTGNRRKAAFETGHPVVHHIHV